MKINIKNGFTLIELLVTITIMGILATIGVATYKQSFYRAWDTERQTAVRNSGNIILTANAVDHIMTYDPTSNMGEFGIGANGKERIIDVLNKEASYVLPSVTTSGFDYYYLYKSDNSVMINCKQIEVGLIYYGTAQASTAVVNQQAGASPICSTSGINNANFPTGYAGVKISS